MPDYLPPRRGVTMAEAMAVSAATADTTYLTLHTFELFHSAGTPDGPIYVVADNEDLLATKEATADRDAGLEVTFMAAAIDTARPEESDSAATPQIKLTVSNVSGEMSEALRRARGSVESWVLIERMYLSNDTSAPAQLPPLELLVTGADMDGETLTLTASYADPANVSVPSIKFRRAEYPGLVP